MTHLLFISDRSEKAFQQPEDNEEAKESGSKAFIVLPDIGVCHHVVSSKFLADIKQRIQKKKHG